MDRGRKNFFISFLAIALPSAEATLPPTKCAFEALMDRHRGKSIQQLVEENRAFMERVNQIPFTPPHDPASDPSTGTSFRAMGVRGAVNPDDLIASLPFETDREKVRAAYESGSINLNQLVELQLICTLTDTRVQKMLDQYARGGGSPGPSSFTVMPTGLKEKVLLGESKPTKPREIRGAHSPTILNSPEMFQILQQSTNPNGTLSVKLKKWVATPGEPQGTWSKPKSSTLAPLTWTEADVDFAGKITLARGKFSKSEVREGEAVTFLRYQAYRLEYEDQTSAPKPESIEWEVIVNDRNEMMSSYPTGD